MSDWNHHIAARDFLTSCRTSAQTILRFGTAQHGRLRFEGIDGTCSSFLASRSSAGRCCSSSWSATGAASDPPGLQNAHVCAFAGGHEPGCLTGRTGCRCYSLGRRISSSRVVSALDAESERTSIVPRSRLSWNIRRTCYSRASSVSITRTGCAASACRPDGIRVCWVSRTADCAGTGFHGPSYWSAHFDQHGSSPRGRVQVGACEKAVRKPTVGCSSKTGCAFDRGCLAVRCLSSPSVSLCPYPSRATARCGATSSSFIRASPAYAGCVNRPSVLTTTPTDTTFCRRRQCGSSRRKRPRRTPSDADSTVDHAAPAPELYFLRANEATQRPGRLDNTCIDNVSALDPGTLFRIRQPRAIVISQSKRRSFEIDNSNGCAVTTNLF